MITIERRQVNGDLQTHIAQLTELRRDLLKLASGAFGFPEIASAPVLDQVILAKRPLPCLIGHVGEASEESQSSRRRKSGWRIGKLDGCAR